MVLAIFTGCKVLKILHFGKKEMNVDLKPVTFTVSQQDISA